MRFGKLVVCGLTVGFVLTGCEKKVEQVKAVEAGLVAPSASTEYLLLDESRVLRFAPTEEERVSDPQTAGDMPNWIGEVLRGDRFTIMKREGDWAKVKHSDDSQGWLPMASLLAETKMYGATVLKDVASLTAASDSAAGGPSVAAGQLLFVDEEASTPEFVRANVGLASWVWVPRSAISVNEDDIAVAVQIVKAKWSRKNDNVGNNARILDKARTRHGKSQLLDVLANEVPFSDLSDKPILDTSDLQPTRIP